MKSRLLILLILKPFIFLKNISLFVGDLRFVTSEVSKEKKFPGALTNCLLNVSGMFKNSLK